LKSLNLNKEVDNMPPDAPLVHEDGGWRQGLSQAQAFPDGGPHHSGPQLLDLRPPTRVAMRDGLMQFAKAAGMTSGRRRMWR
jgi:hypothetical protein